MEYIFSDEVTLPHGFWNMYDDNHYDFYHPNQLDEMLAYQSNRMPADHDDLGNQHEDPNNGLHIDPPTWLP